MIQPSLEERVSVLENTVAALVADVRRQQNDWKSTVGMFAGDAIIAAIQEEGRKIREAERRAARRDQIVILLDTDPINILQSRDPQAAVLTGNMSAWHDQDFGATAITLEEQIRG